MISQCKSFFCLLIHVHLNTDVHWLNRSQSNATYTQDPPKARESSRSRTLVCGTFLSRFLLLNCIGIRNLIYIYLMKKKWGIIIFFLNLYWFCNPMLWKTFQENPKNGVPILLSFDLFLNYEASIQLDASFEKIRTETLQNKLEEWKKTTPFFF